MTASRTTPPLYDRLCDAIGRCEEIEKAFAAADKLSDGLYALLPKAAENFADADKVALDIFPQWRFLAQLKAFLSGMQERDGWESGQPKPVSPYGRVVEGFRGPQFFVRDHDKPLHDAWTEGFKTDEERQDDEAERRSDEEQGR